MGIKIITDSTCDLDLNFAKDNDIKIMPLKVIFGDKEYLDGITISKNDFFDMQAKAKTLPTTSQVNPDDFYSEFKEAIDNDDEVLGIFISSKLSGTYQSAKIAKEMLESDKIHLVDSLSVTCGLGILVKEAVKCVGLGLTASKIKIKLENLTRQIRLIAIVPTLKYLKMGGRISPQVAFIGGMLGISPVISVEKGELNPIGKVRGDAKAVEFIENYLESHPIDLDRSLGFAFAKSDDKLNVFKDKFACKYELSKSYTSEIGPVIGVHTGPDCYGIAYFEKSSS